MRRLAIVCLLSFVAFAVNGQMHFGMMTYNCENAFDTIHDARHDDVDFTPGGERNWTGWKFRKKLRNIARVVLAADSVQPVDVVCLCEVENDSVMTHLTERSLLRSLGYKYIMTDSNNERGTDVALMYMPYTFRMIGSRILRCAGTRDVLHVSGRLLTGDTLDVVAVHLPSKLGGGKAERMRRRIALDIRDLADSLFIARANPNVVVMGDFNADADSKLVTSDLGVKFMPGSDSVFRRNALFQSGNLSAKGAGTYKYRGAWSVIDNIMVTGAMLDSCNSLYTRSEWFRVMDCPFLLERDKSDKTLKPKRSFMGTCYRDGFSDHLPVYVKFNYLFKKSSAR